MPLRMRRNASNLETIFEIPIHVWRILLFRLKLKGRLFWYGHYLEKEHEMVSDVSDGSSQANLWTNVDKVSLHIFVSIRSKKT